MERNTEHIKTRKTLKQAEKNEEEKKKNEKRSGKANEKINPTKVVIKMKMKRMHHKSTERKNQHDKKNI